VDDRWRSDILDLVMLATIPGRLVQGVVYRIPTRNDNGKAALLEPSYQNVRHPSKLESITISIIQHSYPSLRSTIHPLFFAIEIGSISDAIVLARSAYPDMGEYASGDEKCQDERSVHLQRTSVRVKLRAEAER
jgi:hypothetical protein